MNFKKSLLVFCLVMCILFTVSGVSAGDVNDTAIASEDTIENSEDLALIAEESPANDDISDGTLAVSEIDENESVAEIADESAVSVSSDDDALSAKKYKVTFYKETGKFTNDKKVYFKVVNAATGKPVKTKDALCVEVYYTNGEWCSLLNYIPTNSYGIGVYKFEEGMYWDDTYIVKAQMDFEESNMVTKKVIVHKNNLKITAKKLTVPKNSKKKFVIKVVDQNKRPIFAILRVVVFTGNKYIVKTIDTNSKGIATFNGVSKLSEGTHKVKILLERHSGYDDNNGLYAKTATSYIIVGKASASAQSSGKTGVTIKAKGLSATYKSGKYFAAKVVKTSTGAPLKGIPVNVIIYTGNSYKAVTLKTTSKGNIAYSTGKLSVGTHKVVLKIKNNKYYTGKAVTTAIKIVKKSSGSNSNTPSGGKLHTTLTVNECYRPDYKQYYFKVTLKDSQGHKLANKKIRIETYISLDGSSSGMTEYHFATTNSNGVAEGYVAPSANGVVNYQATFSFLGDDSYYSSTSDTRYVDYK